VFPIGLVGAQPAYSSYIVVRGLRLQHSRNQLKLVEAVDILDQH